VKELVEMTLEELVDESMRQMTMMLFKGTSWRDAMYVVTDRTLMWKAAKDQAQKGATAPKDDGTYLPVAFIPKGVMTVGDLREVLKHLKAEQYNDLQVVIAAKTVKASIGPADCMAVKCVGRGIDWDSNRLVIFPEHPLVAQDFVADNCQYEGGECIFRKKPKATLNPTCQACEYKADCIKRFGNPTPTCKNKFKR
jgi:hypothetical protein